MDLFVPTRATVAGLPHHRPWCLGPGNLDQLAARHLGPNDGSGDWLETSGRGGEGRGSGEVRCGGNIVESSADEGWPASSGGEVSPERRGRA